MWLLRKLYHGSCLGLLTLATLLGSLANYSSINHIFGCFLVILYSLVYVDFISCSRENVVEFAFVGAYYISKFKT